MKIFEVICERYLDGSQEIVSEAEYVTTEDEKISTVASYYEARCQRSNQRIKSVREALCVVSHISKGDGPA